MVEPVWLFCVGWVAQTNSLVAPESFILFSGDQAHKITEVFTFLKKSHLNINKPVSILILHLETCMCESGWVVPMSRRGQTYCV